MSLDLKNVIGSFMIGSVIMYAASNLKPQPTCLNQSKVALSSKSDVRLNKTVKSPHDHRNTFDINIEESYKGANVPNSLIQALYHVYKQKQGNYVDFLTFSKQFTNKYPSLEDFISNYKLCKLRDIIFLHASKANSITFDTRNKGFYKGVITETTPYIVNVGNKYFPGVGKLHPHMIDLIKKSYTDITELQHKAPIEINCSGTVRFLSS